MSERDSCDLLCLDAPRAEAIRGTLPETGDLDTLAQGARAYGDATRLIIALALHAGAPLCVCDVGFIVSRDEKLVSHHLRALKSAGLAESHRDGRMVMYELTGAGKGLLEGLLTLRSVRETA
jgi:DNA-binding transcriptional ArsR family regulator